MIIRGFETLRLNGCVRIQAELCPEGTQKAPRLLWYEAPQDDAEGFECSADPFLLVGWMLASLAGESRCLVEGLPICPHMAQHLALLSMSWNDSGAKRYKAPEIQASEGIVARDCGPGRGVMHFVSGGVDAMASIQAHLAGGATARPVKDALCVFGLYGFDCPDGQPDPARVRAWSELTLRMDQVLSPHGIRVRAASTNVRSLFTDFEAWSKLAFYAATASVAHAFRGRWQEAWLASSGAIGPGTCDANDGMPDSVSSCNLWVRPSHPLEHRLERIKRLTSWPEALAVLQPCHHVELPRPGQVNCGACEKCVRTMLALLQLGALERAPFPADVSANQIHRLKLQGSRCKLGQLTELIPGLRRIGRRDLANAIRIKAWKVRLRAARKRWLHK